MAIQSIGPLIQPEAPRQVSWPVGDAKESTAPERPGKTNTFANLLRDVIESDNAAQQAADSYALGTNQNIHETMLTIEKADISFSLLVNVRNKLLEAYREVMRMS